MLYEEFLAKVEKVEHEPVVKRMSTPPTAPDERYSRGGVTGIRSSACRAVLDGDNNSLLTAFDWYSTPQGAQYWVSRRRGDADMSEEDYEFVRSLIV